MMGGFWGIKSVNAEVSDSNKHIVSIIGVLTLK